MKQVAQRATIAHLSPMCQGQISFQKTYKWAMETTGPKSNLSDRPTGFRDIQVQKCEIFVTQGQDI